MPPDTVSPFSLTCWTRMPSSSAAASAASTGRTGAACRHRPAPTSGPTRRAMSRCSAPASGPTPPRSVPRLQQLVPGGEEPATAFTVAANVATGAQRWAELIPPTSGTDTFGVSGAVSPNGGTVYAVVDEFTAGSPVADFTTIAFRA